MFDDMEKIVWTYAKTYAKTAPHEYILKKDYPEVFERAEKALAKYGVDEEFRIFKSRKMYRYYYTQEYRYWIDEGHVLNRDSRFGLKRHTPKNGWVEPEKRAEQELCKQ